MTWNYRVMRGEENGDTYYAVREVHYAEDGTVEGWTGHDAAPFGESFDALITDMAWIATALAKPILSLFDASEVEPARIIGDDLAKVILGERAKEQTS